MAGRRKKRKRPGLPGIIMMFFNIILVLLTLIAYLSNYISPEKLWQPAFAGLAFPFILVLNLIFVFIWLFLRPRYALLSLITIAAGFNITARHVQMNYPDEFEKNERVLHITTFNARCFDIWREEGKANHETYDKVISYFTGDKPDLLCIQEAVISHPIVGNLSEGLKSALGYRGILAEKYYPHGSSGLLICHNAKLMGKGVLTHENRTIAIFADLSMNGQTIRVYNLHLQSAALGKEEYVMENLSRDAYQDSLFLNGSKQIIKKLKHAFTVRSRQVEVVRQHIQDCKYPMIICGDLNDTPCSYAYNKIRNGLNDSFIKTGKGMGRTYHGKFPSFRIDYIFSSKNFSTRLHQTGEKGLSDHIPVSAYLEMPETTE